VPAKAAPSPGHRSADQRRSRGRGRVTSAREREPSSAVLEASPGILRQRLAR
jgi:hypothetical protein